MKEHQVQDAQAQDAAFASTLTRQPPPPCQWEQAAAVGRCLCCDSANVMGAPPSRGTAESP
jgi:hypothetical protein